MRANRGPEVACFFLCFRQVVHAHGDDSHGAGYEIVRTTALAAMTFHVVHRAVKSCGKPVVQPLLCRREVDVADTGLLKAEFATPADDLILERRHIGIAVLVAVSSM